MIPAWEPGRRRFPLWEEASTAELAGSCRAAACGGITGALLMLPQTHSSHSRSQRSGEPDLTTPVTGSHSAQSEVFQGPDTCQGRLHISTLV